ncbi:hypothetical protein Hypma_007434 [Hypsizygus marmoreus]|uniref:Uncharacterized protein n=1 Tax=Hypsizygus marmoreus TaxID=39966 RepID=A0A369JZ22_HYPMA|nr:hypothetical protein Hypma_007434 [Hypsizygus marmoreus]
MVNMPIPTPSPYPDSEDSEGSVLREFVNESIAQEQGTPSPRSELLSQTSQNLRNRKDPSPEHRKRGRRNPTRRQREHNELVPANTPPNELIRLLTDQKHEAHTLRRALRIAAERMDSESQRVIALERAHTQTAEQFRILNESRIAAQQEAMKASQELRLYQFQLENAQNEIARAQEVLQSVEDQRDEAEQAAARARRKARQLQQERLIAVAREEGRRWGFEAGLKRAQEEQALHGQQRGSRTRREHTVDEREAVPNVEPTHPPLEEPLRRSNDDILEGFDQTSLFSSPSRFPLRGLHDLGSPQVVRVAEPAQPALDSEPASPPPQPQVNIPPPQTRSPSPPPPEPVPIVHPEPDVPRSKTPSVQYYAVSIPPTSELEQQYNLNEEYPGHYPQPWVTAQQHSQMSDHQPTPETSFQSNAGSMNLRRGFSLSRRASQPQGKAKPEKKKESWYRTLSRRALGRKRRPEATDEAIAGPEEPPTPRSWYAPKPAPPVRVRDYGIPKPVSSADTASVSTRMSQLDLVSPPNRTPNSSERSLRMGDRPGKKFKDKHSNLFVINEDPGSRVTTPVKEDIRQRSQSMSQAQAKEPEPRYSDPKAVDEWRRSSATSSAQKDSTVHPRPPNGPRRPKHLTVPAPLSHDNMNGIPDPRSHTMSNGTRDSQFSRSQDSNGLRVNQQVSSPGLSPIGISVEPPSRSPSDTLGSSRPENGYLSPDRPPTPLAPHSLRSGPSIATSLGSFQSGLGNLLPNGMGSSSSAPGGPTPRNQYPSSPRPLKMDLHPKETPSRPSSRNQNYAPMASSPLRSPYHLPQPLAGGRSSTPQPVPDTRSVRSGKSGKRGATSTPGPSSQALPPASSTQLQWGSETGSERSRRHSTSAAHAPATPRRKAQALPPANGKKKGHQRVHSESFVAHSEMYLTAGPSSGALLSVDGHEHTLSRVPSNNSINSIKSQGSYAKYDPSTYLDPAFFSGPEDDVGPSGGAGPSSSMNRGSPIPKRHSRAASTNSALSYITER